MRLEHPLMARRSRMLLTVLVAALVLGLTACGSGAAGRAGAPLAAASDGSPAASLTETGSTLLSPLMQTWAAAYQRQFPDVTVKTAATNSTAGIDDASAGTADIGTSDAYLSSGNLVKNPALVNIPLVISAQQVDYNLPGLGAGGDVRGNDHNVERPGHHHAQPRRATATDQGRADAPFGGLRRHVPVQQLPIDAGRGLEQDHRVRHDGGLAAGP